MTHTPTPFHLHDMEAGFICTEGGLPIIDCNAPMLTQEEATANALLVVEACNNYAALKKSHAGLLALVKSAHVIETKAMKNWVDKANKSISAAEGLI